IQRRLALAGMRPISLAVDVTNHVMLELGQPLHAFDHDKVRGDIVVRRAQRDERLRTLDDVDRVLHVDDVVITDDSGPIAIGGVRYAAETVRRRLTQVGCAVDGGGPMLVTPPTWRPDLRRPVDLVEEVVRLEGYDGLPSTVPAAPAGSGLTRPQRQRRTIGRRL